MAGKYNKTPLSIQDQAQLLLNRGLVCTDTKRLEQYLTSIGYYRLSAYWLPFERFLIGLQTQRMLQPKKIL